MTEKAGYGCYTLFKIGRHVQKSQLFQAPWHRSLMKLIAILLTKLSRVTSTGTYIPSVDGMRFLAIFVVVVQHIFQSISHRAESDSIQVPHAVWLIDHVTIGVEIFFVISGFILALPFKTYFAGHGKPIQLKRYYLRRITRLEPPYFVHLTLVAIGQISMGVKIEDVYPHYLSSLLYLSNFIEGRFSEAILNPVTWSLEIEVQFYILAPIFAFVYLVRSYYIRSLIILAATIAIFLLKHYLQLRFGSLPTSLLEYFQYFSAGFMLADCYVEKKLGSKKSYLADLISISSWFGLIGLTLSHIPARSLLMAMLIYVAMKYSFSSYIVNRIFSNVYIRTIGGMCYSIYLLHMPIISWLTGMQPLEHIGYGFALLMYGIPVIIFSGLFFILIERPCMEREWWKKMWPKELGGGQAGGGLY